jgi:hypothetical protein
MKLLVTGKGGKSGSWFVRGRQLGEAIGAEIQPMAEHSDCKSADLIICVKRTPTELMRNIAASGRPWVYDVVDAWPQPAGNAWSREQSTQWLRGTLKLLSPTAVVFGTHRMQEDAQFDGPSIVLPHHAWPKYTPISVKKSVQTVGYEGAENYLGRWQRVIQSECDRRGWLFVVNGDMTKADIGIALRDVPGYPAGAWKPGTKLSNLQALGLPALLSPECGYREQSNGSEYWIEHPDDVAAAFNELADPDLRSLISINQQESAPRLEQVAKDYQAWLRTLV